MPARVRPQGGNGISRRKILGGLGQEGREQRAGRAGRLDRGERWDEGHRGHSCGGRREEAGSEEAFHTARRSPKLPSVSRVLYLRQETRGERRQEKKRRNKDDRDREGNRKMQAQDGDRDREAEAEAKTHRG